MRIVIGGAVMALTLALSACGGSSSTSASEEAQQQRESDLYQIDRIERSFHEAISKKDIDMLVGLFSEHATGTFRTGQTASGKEEIRNAWLHSTAWKPTTHWLSDHPAYKLRITIEGNRGTLHFECHFVDVDTGEVAVATAGSADVAKINGKWLITNFVGSTTELKI